MEKEDGEMSDDNSMLVDEEIKKPVIDAEINSTILYKADKAGVIIQHLEKVDASKLKERAERFGLNLTGNRIVTQAQIDELYSNFGIEDGNERHFRFDTLHLTGVGGLTTKEIFGYLEDYKPVSLEWIDGNSCNVVCQDHISAALALLVHSREIKNENLKGMISENSSHHWREAMPHPKTDLILIRFATNGDEKVSKKGKGLQDDESMNSVSKNPWGDLCRSWGVYEHQEIFTRKLPKHDYEEDIQDPKEIIQIRNKKLALRLGKRSYKMEEREDSDSDSEWKRKAKAPRMRMHADDEETKQKKKQTQDLPTVDRDFYAPLSIEVINSRSNYTPRNTTKLSDKFKSHDRTGQEKDGIRSRLGLKVVPSKESCSSDDCSSDTSEYNVMSRVEKVNSTSKNSDVWSRLETKSTHLKVQHDLRQKLKSQKQNKSDDLRERISKSKQTRLRIEIDNDL